ncbi:hypothetical protein HHL11_24915 [Ramlibacter sp. G-1-2-2]|uniref:Surface-adhesin protein E-like domain-containing protein n=1 Tax=Ramlibacter agri TaxID=2728837 RepID=A0A848HC16_9BURK|nr:surface-adhesin E family protein [Ramlibacter agri]NML47010.1 hypothetical protein [Ramlibacter agri]
MAKRLLLAIACVAACSGASAAAWFPVPGAPEVNVDLGSLEQQGQRVVLWVRWWGRAPLLAQDAPAVHRSTLRLEFDCGARAVRMLEAQGHDAQGRAVFMSSVPGPSRKVTGEDLAWTYDAVCEAARAGS